MYALSEARKLRNSEHRFIGDQKHGLKLTDRYLVTAGAGLIGSDIVWRGGTRLENFNMLGAMAISLIYVQQLSLQDFGLFYRGLAT
jgi:hypothetical protein